MRLLVVLLIGCAAALAAVALFRPLTGSSLSALWVGLPVLLSLACIAGGAHGASDGAPGR